VDQEFTGWERDGEKRLEKQGDIPPRLNALTEEELQEGMQVTGL